LPGFIGWANCSIESKRSRKSSSYRRQFASSGKWRGGFKVGKNSALLIMEIIKMRPAKREYFQFLIMFEI
jgi:hypothetical protein